MANPGTLGVRCCCCLPLDISMKTPTTKRKKSTTRQAELNLQKRGIWGGYKINRIGGPRGYFWIGIGNQYLMSLTMAEAKRVRDFLAWKNSHSARWAKWKQKSIESIWSYEKLLCQHGSHASFPYYAHNRERKFITCEAVAVRCYATNVTGWFFAINITNGFTTTQGNLGRWNY